MVDLSAYELVNKEVHDLLLKELNEKGWDFILQRRVKSPESIERKKQSKPQRVITDYSGVRVILKRISDVRSCIEFISSKFEVDHSNSTFNPLSFVLENEFGYQSSHVVVRHNNLYTEIQVRTLVQHAWALTSHSLRYKESTQDSIFDRKLNRLSGLLEEADALIEELYNTIPDGNQVNLKNLRGIDHYSLEYFFSRKERIFSAINIGFDVREKGGEKQEFPSQFEFSRSVIELRDGSISSSGFISPIIQLCRLMGFSTIIELRDFMYANASHIRDIGAAYRKTISNKNPMIIFLDLRIFIYLLAFFPSNRIDEVIDGKWNAGLSEILREINRDCQHLQRQ